MENTSLNGLDTASLHRNRLLTAETLVRRSPGSNVIEIVLWKIVEHTTRLIIEQQKGIPAHGLLDRIVELLQAIKEGGNVPLLRTTQSVSTRYSTPDFERQFDSNDLLPFEQSTIDN
jgi:hypothetical protein